MSLLLEKGQSLNLTPDGSGLDSDDYNGKTALICGELVRNNNKWSFTTIGKPVIADNFEDIRSLYR